MRMCVSECMSVCVYVLMYAGVVQYIMSHLHMFLLREYHAGTTASQWHPV